MQNVSFVQLSDGELIAEVTRAAAGERRATTQLIALLAEVDQRRLHLSEGCSSLFVYCTRILGLSEHEAYGRITAARLARRFPQVLELLDAGAVTLTTVGLLAPHLTPENCADVLDAARHRSKREVEGLVAALFPQPDIVASIRKLPVSSSVERSSGQPIEKPGTSMIEEPRAAPADPVAPARAPAAVAPAGPRAAVMAPVAPDRYLLRMTVSDQTRRKLQRAQDLLRHTVPNGDPAEIVDQALTLLVAHLEKTKLAASARPRRAAQTTVTSRHIPASVKRTVSARDSGRCAFVGAKGRCDETGFLEFHHVIPYAAGGLSTADNLELRCRAHNAHEASLYFRERLGHVLPNVPGGRGELGPDRVDASSGQSPVR